MTDDREHPPNYEYDVAVSFAGEDRSVVEDVVRKLKARNLQVFYDQDELASIWGENLIDFLQVIYGRKARYAVMFISRHYAEKKWTNYERKITQDRALIQNSPYILPIRLDDTELPGLPSTIAFLDARTVGTDGIVDILATKIGSSSDVAGPRFDGSVPKTPEQLKALLTERPAGWEHMLYAAMLRQGIDNLEQKYRDHLLEYAPSSGYNLDENEGFKRISDNFSYLQGVSRSFNKVLAPAAQEAAFGKPGEAGDPDRILHLAQRFCSVHEEYLDFASKLRATWIDNEDLRHAAEFQARMVDRPIERMRSFVADMVDACDKITARLARGEKVEIEMVVEIDVDEQVMAGFNSALDSYTRSKGIR